MSSPIPEQIDLRPPAQLPPVQLGQQAQMDTSAPQDTYALQPTNSVTQQMTPATPAPADSLGDTSQQNLPPLNQSFQPTLQQANPDLPPAPPTDPNVQYWQQQVNSYNNPWYQQHPILNRLAGLSGYGIPGLIGAPQIAAQLVQKNRQAAMEELSKAQGNQFNVNTLTYVANKLGVPAPAPGAAIDTKSMLEQVQATGQADLLHDYSNYQGQLNLTAQKNALIFQQFIKDKADGKAVGDAPKYVDPPDAPRSLNPFVSIKDMAGPLEAGATQTKSGEESVNSAVESQAKLQEAKAEADQKEQEQKNTLAFHKTAHEDNVGLRQQGLDNQKQFHQDSLDQRKAEEADRQERAKNSTRDPKIEAYKNSWESAEKNTEALRKSIEHNNDQIVQYHEKWKKNKGDISADPAYLGLLKDNKVLQQRLKDSAIDRDTKKQLYEASSGIEENRMAREAGAKGTPQTQSGQVKGSTVNAAPHYIRTNGQALPKGARDIFLKRGIGIH